MKVQLKTNKGEFIATLKKTDKNRKKSFIENVFQIEKQVSELDSLGSGSNSCH